MSAFLNGHFLGSAQGTAHSQDGIDVLNVTYTFNTAHLISGDNGQSHEYFMNGLGLSHFQSSLFTTILRVWIKIVSHEACPWNFLGLICLIR